MTLTKLVHISHTDWQQCESHVLIRGYICFSFYSHDSHSFDKQILFLCTFLVFCYKKKTKQKKNRITHKQYVQKMFYTCGSGIGWLIIQQIRTNKPNIQLFLSNLQHMHKIYTEINTCPPSTLNVNRKRWGTWRIHIFLFGQLIEICQNEGKIV